MPEIQTNYDQARADAVDRMEALQKEISALSTAATSIPDPAQAAPEQSAVPSPAPAPAPNLDVAGPSETVAPITMAQEPTQMDYEPTPSPSGWSREVSGLMDDLAELRVMWQSQYGIMTDDDFNDLLRETFGAVINATPQLFRSEIARHKQAMIRRLPPSTSRASPVAKRTRSKQ